MIRVDDFDIPKIVQRIKIDNFKNEIRAFFFNGMQAYFCMINGHVVFSGSSVKLETKCGELIESNFELMEKEFESLWIKESKMEYTK